MSNPLINVTAIKRRINEQGFQCSDETTEAVGSVVNYLIDYAIKSAKARERKRVQPHDVPHFLMLPDSLGGDDHGKG